MKFLNITILFLALTFNLNSQTTKTNDELATKLIKEIGIQSTIETSIKIMIFNYSLEYDKVPEAKWEAARKEIDIKGYMQKIKNLYAESFTAEELKKLSQFFKAKKMDQYKLIAEKIDPQMKELGKEFGDLARLKLESVIEK